MLQNFAQIEQEMAQLVEENKHFTTPSKFLNEFPVALKAENEKTREELEKMQDCGKQMGVLALNAAIEAGRMGEGGKQFVTAAETIRVSAGTYDELIDQAHKRLADSDERIAELEEQVHPDGYIAERKQCCNDQTDEILSGGCASGTGMESFKTMSKFQRDGKPDCCASQCR